MRVLHLLHTVDPSSGGPMEAVRQSGIQCESLGHVVEIATLDDPAMPYVSEYPLPVHALGPSAGSYGYSRRFAPWLRAHARDYDAVIINGLWQYHGFAAWRVLQDAGVPYYVYPHGMLDPWFKRRYPLKHFKKWLYWPWAEYRVLRDAKAVLFTCEEERRLARESFWLYRAREQIVNFGTGAPPRRTAESQQRFFSRHPELLGKRIWLFLGRIHVKKGCDLLIEAYSRVASVDPDVHLLMAGPDTSGWANELRANAASKGLSARITWPGMLRGDAKWDAFHASEMFVLPSHQENFGIAVAEAMGCGIAVLVSNKVNIWREIESDGAGLVCDDTVEGTETSLRRWLDLDAESRRRMGERAETSFKRRFTVDAMATSLMAVLQHRAAA